MSDRDKRLGEIASKFQKDMGKLGLGVTIQAGDRAPVTVTWACPSCHSVAPSAGGKPPKACPKCGELSDA